MQQKLHLNDQANATVKASPIDARIHIPACPSGYKIAASPSSLQQSNITVKASCDDNDWFLYFVVRVMQVQPVVVAVNAMSPGAMLTKNDLNIIKMDKNRIRATTFSSIEQLLGARVKRRLTAGQPVVPEQLCFICKGDNITIVAKGTGIEVKTSGTAQQDGNIGDHIMVRNDHSKRVIRGTVDSTNEVSVEL